MSTIVSFDNCVRCIEEFTSKRNGFDELISTLLKKPESLRSFTISIDIKNVPVMQKVFNLFTALSSYSKQGYLTAQLLLQDIKVSIN